MGSEGIVFMQCIFEFGAQCTDGIGGQDGRKWHAIERLLNPNADNDSVKDEKPNKRGSKVRKFKGKKLRHAYKKNNRADRSHKTAG